MKKIFSKKYIQVVTVIILSFIIAFFAELMFNVKVLGLKGGEKGVRQIGFDKCTATNLQKTGEGYVLKKGSEGNFTFEVNGYVDRIVIGYDTDTTYSQTLMVDYRNIYNMSEVKVINDSNPVYLDETVVNIRKYVNKITLNIPELSDDVTIKYISVRNTAQLNWLRVAFFVLGLSSIGLIIVFRKIIADKVHVGFAIVAATVGLSMVLVMPLVRVGFDEEAHFRCSFVLSLEKTTIENTTLWNMLNAADENHPAFRSGSYDEYKAFYRYLNENALYTDNGVDTFRVTPRNTSGMATFSYIIFAFFMSLARLCKMSFGNIYILGRLVNLIVYVTTMTFAIRKIKKGKILLSVIGLLPTVMFLSSTISYDPFVLSFISLGMAYLLNAVMDEEKITVKDFILGCLFLGIGCTAKAIYAPLFLVGLMIPADRFKDKKTGIIMKTGFVICFLVLMATAMLPTMLGQDSGDSRGGNTSHISQLGCMTGNLFGYFGLMMYSIISRFITYSVGPIAIDTMYFFGTGKCIVVLDIILTAVVLTLGEDGFRFKKKQKAAFAGIIFIIVALIWTSLYMAFTEVGVASSINGVQGRYFIPLLFLGLSMFATPKIKCSWNKEKFYPVILIAMSLILSFETYSQIIVNSCG